MHFSVLFALLAVATTGAHPRATMIMECYPETPRVGDVMIVKITAINNREEPILLPSAYDPVLGYLRIEIGHPSGAYRYNWRGHGHGMGYSPLVPLTPGGRRVVVFEAVELGPGLDINHDFWTAIAEKEGPVHVQTHLSHPDGDSYAPHSSLDDLRSRPPEEIEALAAAYASTPPEQFTWPDFPQPADLGVTAFPPHLATPEKLAELERKLSAGTLRHILTASRLMQIIDEAGEPFQYDDVRRNAAAQELIALLDASEPLEREWLASNIFKWFYYRGGPGESGQIPDMIEWEFVERVAERLAGTTVDRIVGHALGKLHYWPFLKEPQEREGFVVSLEIDDWRHQLYDPLFTRVRLTNHSDEAVMVGSGLFHNSAYWLGAGRFRYQFQSERRYLRYVEAQSLAAGEEWIVDYEALQTPPLEMHSHSFWNELPNRTATVEAEVSLRVGEEKRPVEPRASRGLAFRIRPKAETDFINSLYAELLQREQVGDRAERSVDVGHRPLPTPETFGLRGFGGHEDLVERLLEYEDQLSPGELRDIVHLTRLMREMEAEADESEQPSRVDRVLQFLDELPPIERETLLIRIIDWYQPLSQNHSHFRLVDGALKRLPKNLFQHDDYPVARREELEQESTAFREFGKRHVGEDYRVKPQPDSMPSEFNPFGGSRNDDPFKQAPRADD